MPMNRSEFCRAGFLEVLGGQVGKCENLGDAVCGYTSPLAYPQLAKNSDFAKFLGYRVFWPDIRKMPISK